MKFRAVCFLALMLLAACTQQDPKHERERRAARGKGDIVIGAVAPWANIADKGMYRQGIETAVEELNSHGGVMHRKIDVLFRDDKGSVSEGRIIAQELVDNPDVMAVIGHYNSYISVPTAIIYQFYGMLMLSPTSTNPALTRGGGGYNLIFRNIPTDEEVARQLAEYAYRKGYTRLMVYYVKDDYGRGLANAFEERAGELGCVVVDRLSYDSTSNAKFFRKDLATWKSNFAFDAIFLAGVVPQAAEFIVEARQMGITVPILGGDGLDSPLLQEVGGKYVEGTIVGTYFHPDDPRPEVQEFDAAFKKKYGKLPDAWAVQGYDAVKVLAFAMKKAGSTAPERVADALRSIKDWPGVTGPHTFDKNGDVRNKPVVLESARLGGFEFLERSGEKAGSPKNAAK